MRYAYPTDPQALYAWASRLIDDLNRTDPSIDALPTFTGDAEAAAGNVRVGQGYVTPDGIVRRRIA
jgi:hypothetical protein